MTWRRHDSWICAVLVLGTLAIYSGVRHFEFVDFDDPDYANAPQIRHGITPEAVKWAITSGDSANWFPLTRLSHLLDYQLYGPESGPPHIVNVAIHTLACLFLFLFLRRATGALWKSAFVALLFAWHPLHVESVAWVAERKDVLCAFFWFLTLWLWVRFAECPGWRRYLPALLSFCLGLMSKPMIVTLPLILLLVDAWPLRRPFSRKLVLEKLPFLAIAAAGSVVTFLVQHGAGAVARMETFPLGLRVENVLITFVIYIARTIWPVHLAFWYPYPEKIFWIYAVLSGLAILAASTVAFRNFRERPWGTVGWFWFVITLIPVVGLVQVGMQARADRYMYIPMAGLLITAVWGAESVVVRWPHTRQWVVTLGTAACVVIVPVTWFQIQTWSNSESLFTHAAEVTSGNYVAYNNLGAMNEKIPGRLDEAYAYLEMARRVKPGFAPAWYNLGRIELQKGKLAEAAGDFGEALRLNPNYGDARNNMGVVLSKEGRWSEAVPHLQEAVQLSPDSAEAQRNLGEALLKTGRVKEAVESLEAAVRLSFDDAGANNMLGFALAAIPGRLPDAISHLRNATRIEPGLATAHANLGRLLSQLPDDRAEAVAELQTALRMNPYDEGTREFLKQIERATR